MRKDDWDSGEYSRKVKKVGSGMGTGFGQNSLGEFGNFINWVIAVGFNSKIG